MNPELEKILACPTLPSLPAVALRVIELTSDMNVSLRDLAATIQNDQGLAAKILKTVNSSFYGLRQRCASIDKALVLLGLSPVKSLALGFSLVDSINDSGDGAGFDYVGYWRRGLYTGIAGKVMAERAGLEIGDEVFLGGLLQDVGMIAMHEALGEEYLEVVAKAGADHRELAQRELEALDLQHSQVGAMLVERWKLPDELILPVKYHERPSAAPSACVEHVHCVGLGNLVHDVLTVEDSVSSLQRLYDKSKNWFKLSPETVDEIVAASGEAAKEMASLFKLDVGPYTDPEAVLAEAGKRAVSMAREAPVESGVSSHVQENSVLAGSDVDPLTGAVGPRGFEVAIREGVRFASEADDDLALVEVVIDEFGELESRLGEGADVESTMGIAGVLKHVFEGHGGVVCHLGKGTFAIVIPSMGRLTATGLAKTYQSELARQLPSWTAPADGSPLTITTSIGIAAYEDGTREVFDEPRKLVLACAKAVQAGQAAGGSTMRIFHPRAKAA